MGRLFGTDGIRGVANRYPITADMALKLGRSLGGYLSAQAGRPARVVVGRDTRISGNMLECAVAAGLCSTGAMALPAGVLPTPGVAYLTRCLGADAGVVISASHNPFADNGIKIFDRHGFKLSDVAERELESLILAAEETCDMPVAENVGRVEPIRKAGSKYVEFLKTILPGDKPLQGLSIAVDCSNGATSRVAGPLFESMGASVHVCCDQPDGVNINDGCGSQYLQPLQAAVRKTGADVGLAFDGDGDRLIALDERAHPVTGDRVLAICARRMKQLGRLRNNAVVATVMSNLGFKKAMRELDIRVVQADVGDRSVMERMQASDAVLGGEDSGHLIFLEHHSTGDGMLSALKLLETMVSEQQPLSALSAIMKSYPQEMINVPVKHKPVLETLEEIRSAIRTAEARLGDEGRVLVRYSGTQPLCRVMVEGPTPESTLRCCRAIAETVAAVLGK